MNRSNPILLRSQHRTNDDVPEAAAHQRGARAVRLAVAAALGLSTLAAATVAVADDSLPPISIGAGVRSSFDTTKPDGGKETDDFNLDDVRLYVSGSVTNNIKFMFNTDYNDGTKNVTVIDAAAQFSFSDQLNIWAGRFLPPSDRANMYGPYYANQWNVFQDGVQDGYASGPAGRDNGLMYWGQFGPVKVSAGAFDVPSTLHSSGFVTAERAQIDLWDPEGGYYLNGTYYGDKDLLAIGIAGQQLSSSKNAYSADFLLEKKLPNLGVISVEAEYAKYDNFGGYGLPLEGDSTPSNESDGAYGLVSYLFPQVIGIGKFQLLGKYAKATLSFDGVGSIGQKTKDFELNYIIKEFNARVSVYYTDFKFDSSLVDDYKMFGVGLQLQL